MPFAHAALASQLELSAYTNELHEVLSLQLCATARQAGDRLQGGRDAAYAFVYPNLMINRYGPWMDTNVVLPLDSARTDACQVIFDYWLQPGTLRQAAADVLRVICADTAQDPQLDGLEQNGNPDDPSNADLEELKACALRSDYLINSLASSHAVQQEDIALCEAVQGGLEEPSYGSGRYVPGVEGPMFHFHKLLYGAVMNGGLKSAQQLNKGC